MFVLHLIQFFFPNSELCIHVIYMQQLPIFNAASFAGSHLEAPLVAPRILWHPVAHAGNICSPGASSATTFPIESFLIFPSKHLKVSPRTFSSIRSLLASKTSVIYYLSIAWSSLHYPVVSHLPIYCLPHTYWQHHLPEKLYNARLPSFICATVSQLL